MKKKDWLSARYCSVGMIFR